MHHMQQNICSPAKDIRTFTLTDSKACGVTKKKRKMPDLKNAKTSIKAACS